MKLLNIGFGNMVSEQHIIAIIGSDSAPVKRMVQEARAGGRLIDATYGRKCRAVLVMDSGHLVLSGLAAEAVAQRAGSDCAAEGADD